MADMTNIWMMRILTDGLDVNTEHIFSVGLCNMANIKMGLLATRGQDYAIEHTPFDDGFNLTRCHYNLNNAQLKEEVARYIHQIIVSKPNPIILLDETLISGLRSFAIKDYKWWDYTRPSKSANPEYWWRLSHEITVISPTLLAKAICLVSGIANVDLNRFVPAHRQFVPTHGCTTALSAVQEDALSFMELLNVHCISLSTLASLTHD